MKNIKLTLFISLCLITSLVSSQSVYLSFNPEKGSRYNEKLNLTQNITTKMEGLGMDQEVKSDISVYATSEFLGKNDKKNILLKQKFTRMTMDMEMMGMSLNIDTDNEDEANDMEANVLKDLKPMINKDMISEIGKDGKILDVEISEDLQETFSKYASTLNNSNYSVLPNRKVKINDTWNYVNESDANNGLIMVIDSEYTLIAINGGKATVSIKGVISQKKDEKREDENETVKDLTINSGTLEGTGVIDIKTGNYIENTLNMKFDMSMTANDMNATTIVEQNIIRTLERI